jgi:hypothetical protein
LAEPPFFIVTPEMVAVTPLLTVTTGGVTPVPSREVVAAPAPLSVRFLSMVTASL